MVEKSADIPDSTAVRVALWRALHVQLDARPLVFEDEIGLKLVAPGSDWQARPDMNPQWTGPFRASIVGRARFIEDLLAERVSQGLNQYVLLGAGLDSFAQRRPESAVHLRVFEIDKPETQAWKHRRLIELGYGVSDSLELVPVDFESGQSWWDQLMGSGFDPKKPALVTSLGVSMYLSHEAIVETLQQMKKLAPGSTFVMTFMLPLDLVNSEDRPGYEMALKGAQASGTPFISLFSPQQMLALVNDVGFKGAQHLSTMDLIPRYFANRTDGLKPSSGEEFLILTI
ncbi:MAG: class I SAM-dependent methyltransferase [Bdellovibrionaceae bacterium]|nr:class I SAM-dependent methyltransferase [Pseudobdellovibrionaceae bacterium]